MCMQGEAEPLRYQKVHLTWRAAGNGTNTIGNLVAYIIDGSSKTTSVEVRTESREIKN